MDTWIDAACSKKLAFRGLTRLKNDSEPQRLPRRDSAAHQLSVYHAVYLSIISLYG